MDAIKVGDTVRVCKIDTKRYGQRGEVVGVRRDSFFPIFVRFEGVTLGYFETDLQVVTGE